MLLLMYIIPAPPGVVKHYFSGIPLLPVAKPESKVVEEWGDYQNHEGRYSYEKECVFRYLFHSPPPELTELSLDDEL